jgi:hypothetical protein
VAYEDKERCNWYHHEVAQEHSLILSRMSCYLTSQSFLVTAYVITGPKENEFRWLALGPWPVLPLLGLVISVMIFASLVAAWLSMMRLREKEERTLHKMKETEIADLWTGFGQRLIHKFGMLPVWIPVPFIALWVGLWIATYNVRAI